MRENLWLIIINKWIRFILLCTSDNATLKSRAVKQYIWDPFIVIVIVIIGEKDNILFIDYWHICYIVLQYNGPILIV